MKWPVNLDALEDSWARRLYLNPGEACPGRVASGEQDCAADPGHGGDGRSQNRQATRDRVFPQSADAGDEREFAGAVSSIS